MGVEGSGGGSMTTFGRSRWSRTIKTLLGGFSGRADVDRDGWGNKLDGTEAVGDPARLGLQTQLSPIAIQSNSEWSNMHKTHYLSI